MTLCKKPSTGLEITYYSSLSDAHPNTLRVLAKYNNTLEGYGSRLEDYFDYVSPDYYEYRSLPVAVARKNRRIVGWATAERVIDSYHINVYVLPDYRRQGIGTELVMCLRRNLRKKLVGQPWDDRSLKFLDRTVFGRML